MQKSVDLNADMGEGVGDDAALLQIVSSANIACGLHGGDAQTMARTIELALENGVALGAHPGFDDRANFGRTRMELSAPELANLITYQVGAFVAQARALGGKVQHLKLHGALANMASERADIARTCYEAALDVQPDLTLMVMAATAQERVAQKLGVPYAAEIFADRAYAADGTLVDRSQPGAVIHDAPETARRILGMLDKGAIVAVDGTVLPSRIDSICLHGDGARAVALANGLRAALLEAGVEIHAP